VCRPKMLTETSSQFDPWVLVATAANERGCAELALVLTARGIEHRRVLGPGGWELHVPAASARRAAEELAAYRAENARKVGRRELVIVDSGWPGMLAYLAVLLLVFVALHGDWLDRDWLAAGRLDTGAFLTGQWWRAVTALTVHVDLDHLLGNLAFGAFFGYFAGRYLGRGIGWLAIVGAAALGDALDALVQGPGHASLGASTAVFAAVGLMSAYTWRRGFWKPTPWRSRITPIIAGLGLLAFTGTGGENTDLVAHLAGFGMGLVTGLSLARLATQRLLRSRRAQAWCAGTTVAAVVVAWIWGLAVAG
jgi:membrane associated rhomboid family serine protease